jgi:hypothetical protein
VRRMHSICRRIGFKQRADRAQAWDKPGDGMPVADMLVFATLAYSKVVRGYPKAIRKLRVKHKHRQVKRD